jgi:alcohol dehydrogenase, propanol-preferring
MASIPKTMLAWQREPDATEAIRNEVAVPSAPPDGLLIKIHAAGVCHSDVGILKTKNYLPSGAGALTLGHEGAGVIVQVGPEVAGFKVGERVAIHPVAGCQAPGCGECSRNLVQICNSGERYGITTNGSYAPYVAIKAHHAARLPDNVSFEQGASATDACSKKTRSWQKTGRNR